MMNGRMPPQRFPPQRFQQKNLKPKVLVMGHTWVKDIEEHHLRNPILDYDLEFAYEEGIRISGLIDMIPRVMATYHTHILLFSVLPDALSLYSIESKNPVTAQYKVLGPNKDFDPEYFALQMNIFTEHCKVINPKVKIILMIPPVTDLVYHNNIRVNHFPFMIQSAYRANPQYDERLLYMCMKDLYSSIMLLKSSQCKWMEKLVYPLQNVALAISIIRVPLGKFINGEINTMGETSHLRDGFHPNPLFIEKMWIRLRNTGLLSLDANTANPRMPLSGRLQGRITMTGATGSAQKMKETTTPIKSILKKKKLNTSPSTTTTQHKMESTSTMPKKEYSSPVSIMKRPSNSNPVLVQNESKAFSGNNIKQSSSEIQDSTNDDDDSVCEIVPNNLISQKSLSTTPKPKQLVNISYMSQEIEKFASFMAGHAHAVGQSLSLRDIKQMMMDALKEQL